MYLFDAMGFSDRIAVFGRAAGGSGPICFRGQFRFGESVRVLCPIICAIMLALGLGSAHCVAAEGAAGAVAEIEGARVVDEAPVRGLAPLGAALLHLRRQEAREAFAERGCQIFCWS